MNDQEPTEEYVLPAGMLLNSGCYRITRKLGQGGFGITYLAKQLGFMEYIGEGQTRFRRNRMPEDVVIKELFYKDYCTRDSETHLVSVSTSQGDKKIEFEKLVNKQVEEGMILRQLDHPGIVNNRNIFKENGTAYIVMDYIQGQDLEEVLRREKKLRPDAAIGYMTQLLQALEHIHERKIMHLDIKPSNIFIRSGYEAESEDGNMEHVKDDSAVLIDFGASLVYDENDAVKNTTSKLISGVSSYAPIEQREGITNLKKFNATLDIFSLAGTFYHCLTGQMPAAPSLRASADEDPLKLPSSFKGNEALPEVFDIICKKGLSIKARERYLSAAEFLAAIAAVGYQESDYERHLKRGREYEENFDFENALVQYRLADSKLANQPECISRIAYCTLQLDGKRRSAEAQRAAEEKKQNYTHWVNQAKNFNEAGHYPEAIEAVEEALSCFPDNEDAKTLLKQLQEKNDQTRIIAGSGKPVAAEEPPVPAQSPAKSSKSADPVVIMVCCIIVIATGYAAYITGVIFGDTGRWATGGVIAIAGILLAIFGRKGKAGIYGRIAVASAILITAILAGVRGYKGKASAGDPAITSPADTSKGNRASYSWLGPDSLKNFNEDKEQIKNGIIPDHAKLCNDVFYHPWYKKELATILAQKAKNLGDIPESMPYREAGYQLLFCNYAEITFDRKLYKELVKGKVYDEPKGLILK